MTSPTQIRNEQRRIRLIRMLAPTLQHIERQQIQQAPYAINPEVPAAQHNALIDHAIELGGPPGPVIARTITTHAGPHLEVLVGWERFKAFTHPDAYPRAPKVPVNVIECNNVDAAYYAIEYAARDHKAAGLVTSPLLYAAAAQAALEHFSRPDAPWSIQHLANALCIARPTLSNRLRLLKGLQPTTRQLLQRGLIKPEFAKILLAELSPVRQERLATRVSHGELSTRALYQLVHPGYTPPQVIPSPRGQALQRSANVDLMERTLSENYGTTITIDLDAHTQKGSIKLPFHSLSALKGLLEKLDKNVTTDALIQGNLTVNMNNQSDANALLQELGANDDPVLE